MTGKDPNDMTASELLRKAADGYDGGPGMVMECMIDLMGFNGNASYAECFEALSDKIDAEIAQARGEALLQGAMVWAKANGWPDFKAGEDFGAWLDRCALPRPRFEDGEPVQFGDEAEVRGSMGEVVGMAFNADGCCEVTISFEYDSTATHYIGPSFDGERVKRPAPEALGADGKPIVSGETAYDTKTGIEIVVSRITKDEGGNVIVCASGDICELQFDPRHITHTPPDTQERIDTDSALSPREYYDRYIGPVVGKVCEDEAVPAMIAHLLRRQRELDKRTGGAE